MTTAHPEPEERLRALAEYANTHEWGEARIEALQQLHDSCTPSVVLALLDEVQRLRDGFTADGLTAAEQCCGDFKASQAAEIERLRVSLVEATRIIVQNHLTLNGCTNTCVCVYCVAERVATLHTDTP